jgi:hypothetical protein
MVKLDDRYKFVDAIDALGVPSLAGCDTLTVSGEVRFEQGVVIAGSVAFEGSDGPLVVAAGRYGDE